MLNERVIGERVYIMLNTKVKLVLQIFKSTYNFLYMVFKNEASLQICLIKMLIHPNKNSNYFTCLKIEKQFLTGQEKKV